MQRTNYARTMLRWLGYSTTAHLRRDLAGRRIYWQVTARSEEHVIVARAPTKAEAWFEACRLGELLESQD